MSKRSNLRPEEVNGKVEYLAPNEMVEDALKCPDCGGDLITNYGPGISITFCTKCGYSDDDITDDI